MKKLWILSMFVLFAVSVAAISFYGDTSFKGYAITNISMVEFADGTNMTTAASGTGGGGWNGTASTNLNMTNHNITNVACIVYQSGGMDCSQ